jgi:hypothetical protein
MKTIIWGRHRWDFYKFANDQKETPIGILTPYFTKNNAVIPKKKQEEIKEFCKIIEKMTWFPLDRLYLRALSENSITGEKIDLDLSKKEHREKFIEKSKINPSEFFRWILYVMDWEKLETIDDILSNFFTLQSKFQSFIQSDLNHETLKEIFNASVAELDEHNIESIVNLNEVDVLVSEKQSPGTYEVKWNASQYSSGVYFYKLESINFTETKSMLLIK